MNIQRICRDQDCPNCGWPETFTEVDFDASPGPLAIGCSKCGWTDKVRLNISEGHYGAPLMIFEDPRNGKFEVPRPVYDRWLEAGSAACLAENALLESAGWEG